MCKTCKTTRTYLVKLDANETEMAEKRLSSIRECKTADEVANHIRACGVKGHLQAAHSCAISEYVKQDTSATYYSHVVGTVQDYVSINDKEHPITDAMRDFITRFDVGVYPDLVTYDWNPHDQTV